MCHERVYNHGNVEQNIIEYLFTNFQSRMNFAKIRKAIVSRKDAKYFMYVPNNLYEDVPAVTRHSIKRECFSKDDSLMNSFMSDYESDRMYEKIEESTHYYEVMDEVMNCERELKQVCFGKSKRKQKKSKKIEEKLHTSQNYYPVTKSRECFNQEEFQSNDTLVPTFISPQYRIQTDLDWYERMTGIDQLEKVIDEDGNDYYMLDF
eukprot:TRINITY_DN14327_c0_g1_i1.p1 TRINITY_DN14327_c0_g1~~TRINITY_DN14327_c0_g1_i1.p1  ORF type:complete len:206 (-),score=33.50 TRINITY_DN14327_c0_g1_i1:19-636(-)